MNNSFESSVKHPAGSEFKLKFTTRGIAQLEEFYDRSFQDCLDKMQSERRISDMARFVQAATIPPVHIEQVHDWFDEFGMVKFAEPIGEAIEKSPALAGAVSKEDEDPEGKGKTPTGE